MTGFSEWIDSYILEMGYASNAEAARALGVDPTVLMRWRTAKKPPTSDTIRKVSEAMGVPIQRALVAAGYMRDDEAQLVEVQVRVPLKPESLSNAQLLAEFARRMGEDDLARLISNEESARGEVVAMRSSRSADPDLPTWQPPTQ